MSGARQRGTTGLSKTALESIEAGYHPTSYSDTYSHRHSDAPSRSMESTSNTFVRRRKGSGKSRLGWVSFLKTKLRQIQIKIQRHHHHHHSPPPSFFSRFMTVSVSMLILFGIMTVITYRYSISSASLSLEGFDTTRNAMHVTRQLNSFRWRDSLWQRLPMTTTTRSRNRADYYPDIDIIISSIPSTILHSFHYPSNRQFKKILGLVPDRGGLSLVFFDDRDARRYVIRDAERDMNDYRDPSLPRDDDLTDAYYYFDDDYLRGLNNVFEHQVITTNNNNNTNNNIQKRKRQCRRIAEHRMNLQNCNEFHQLDRLDPASRLTYLNAGTYRQVFGIMHGEQRQKIVIKGIAHELEFKHENYEFVRMDAIVAERLSASPRTFDIYGFCGVAILSEYFYHSDIERDVIGGNEGYMDPKNLLDQDTLKPQNNLTGIEKLVLSLEMAEALADLHGYVNGLIVHDDVQLSQFLFNKYKTRLKLNDFNRAEFPLFDVNNQEYCPWKNGPGYGNWRSPEEYQNLPLTEQIDVWSLGNNMYTLLTGLYPLYDEESSSVSSKRIIKGEIAFIDPRYHEKSPSEAILTEVILKCFAYQPQDRPTIFDLVKSLRIAVKENLSPGMTRSKVLQGIQTRY